MAQPWLTHTPRIGDSGVKLWCYDLIKDYKLKVYDRPIAHCALPSTKCMLQLYAPDGSLIANSFAPTVSDAARLCGYIERDLDEAVEDAAYQIIIRATAERGIRQALALAEMARRGLWLTPEQKAHAGLPV